MIYLINFNNNMKRDYLLFIVLTVLFTSPVLSQNNELSSQVSQRPYQATERITIDTCKLRVQYSMNSVNDVKNPSLKATNIMLLQIGKHFSKYSDYYMLRSDSFSTIYAQQKMDEIEALKKILVMTKGCKSFNIFKNYPNKKISTYDYMPMGGFYKYNESMDRPKWKLISGNMTICGYICKKAIVSFRGRNYTAWYTEKIAISDGPWKFWGLPGLILNISDDKNEYSFECIAIEKPRWTDNIYILDLDYFGTTKERFNAGVKKFYENPKGVIESSGNIKSGLPGNIKSRPYNPIELSE